MESIFQRDVGVSRSRFGAGLAGEGVAYGITWLPQTFFQEIVGGVSADRHGRALSRFAVEAELDFCLVPSAAPWASSCVSSLHDAGIAAVWAVPGPLGIVAGRLGWPETLRATVATPEAIAGDLTLALRSAADLARTSLDVGADAVLIADDIASSAGWLVSPDFVLSTVIPHIEELVRETAPGMPAFFHSDGDIRAAYGALAAAGFAGVHIAAGADSLSSAAAASQHGLRTMGGIVVAALDAPGGDREGETCSVGGIDLVCDDGGMASIDTVAAVLEQIQRLRRHGRP